MSDGKLIMLERKVEVERGHLESAFNELKLARRNRLPFKREKDHEIAARHRWECAKFNLAEYKRLVRSEKQGGGCDS